MTGRISCALQEMRTDFRYGSTVFTMNDQTHSGLLPRKKRAAVIQTIARAALPNSLRFFRALMRLSLYDVARAVHCQPQNLWRAEKFGKGLSDDYWLAIARLFGVSLEELRIPREVVIPYQSSKKFCPVCQVK